MAKYRYVAMDSKGSETEGVLDAENQSQAIALIRSKGFFPTRVVPVDGAKSAGSKRSRGGSDGKGGLNKEITLPGFLRGRVKPKQLMTFTRQLATLVEAGLPLLRGFYVKTQYSL